MKTRIVLYGENDKPISILGDNPQEKVKKAWDAVIAFFAINTDDIMRVESVEVWDNDIDTPQTKIKTGCSRCEDRWDCPDRNMPHAVHCNNYGKRRKGGSDDTRRI